MGFDPGFKRPMYLATLKILIERNSLSMDDNRYTYMYYMVESVILGFMFSSFFRQSERFQEKTDYYGYFLLRTTNLYNTYTHTHRWIER